MWISPRCEAAGPQGSRGANEETAPFGSPLSRCSKAGRGACCWAPGRRHRVARPAATARCGRIRAGSPGRRVPADARRGWRALGAARSQPGACPEPRRQEARAALGRRPRQPRSRRVRDARGGAPTAGRALRSPQPAPDRVGPRRRRRRARPDSAGCSLGWSTRRLPQRGANSSHLVGVNGGPAAEGQRGFNRDSRPVRGSDFLPTGFAHPRLKCLGLTCQCSSFPVTSVAGGRAPVLHASRRDSCAYHWPRRPHHLTCGQRNLSYGI